MAGLDQSRAPSLTFSSRASNCSLIASIMRRIKAGVRRFKCRVRQAPPLFLTLDDAQTLSALPPAPLRYVDVKVNTLSRMAWRSETLVTSKHCSIRRARVSGGDHRLENASGISLASVQHDGRSREGPGDHQYGSRQPIHGSRMA